jgi:UDPglucose 6-dehydrogenase
VFEKLDRAFGGDMRGKTVALWGLAFKPETDDMREAPALVVVDKLLAAGATVRAFDPEAMEEARRRFGDRMDYASTMYEAVDGADALVLLTEWKQFRLPDWALIRQKMQGNIIVDGRNIYEQKELRQLGFYYDRIGQKI